MRGYMIFGVSFILAFSLIRFLSVLLVTRFYNWTSPPGGLEWTMENPNQLPETVYENVFSSFLMTLIISFVSASIAYFISRKMSSISHVNK